MIYVQSDSEKTRPHHFDCSCAMFGAIETGEEYRLKSYEEVENADFNINNLIKRNLFVGSVEFMTLVFNKVGISNVKLPQYSNREYNIITLEEAMLINSGGKSIFIKPEQTKLFSGLILDGSIQTCLKDIPKDTKVICYEPFKHRIETEWRIYIHMNRIEDSRNYSGNYLLSPHYGYVKNIVNTNKHTFPVGYTIDVGVLSSGDTVVIEYNDMWAIGNYGVPNNIYLNMLKSRYFEIIRNGR